MLNTETLRPGPRCTYCGKPGPTINSRCVEHVDQFRFCVHLDLASEGQLYCLSPEDLEALGLL
jgi:hypothetical protein